MITAQEQFEAFNFDSEILPYWGALEAQQLLKECGGEGDAATGQ